MPKYLVHCSSGFCGVDDNVVIECDDEGGAEDAAREWWNDQVAMDVYVEKEITDEDGDEYDDYQEIT